MHVSSGDPRLPFDHQSSFPKKSAYVAGAVVLVVGFGAGFVVGGAWRPISVADSSDVEPAGVNMAPVWKAWQVIDEKFVPAAVATSTHVASTSAEVNQDRVWGMIQGLAESLNDPYTFFLPPTENKMFEQDMSGAFEGVGMEIAVRDEVLTVVSPIKGNPAEKAGIKSGDKILKINGELTKGMDISTAVEKIRGPKGSAVVLTVLRDGWTEAHDISVMRDVIDVPAVTTTARADGVFVITLSSFTSNSPDLFRDALRSFVESHDTKLVLDLRGNPGGYLEAAVDMASWFLPSGSVIVTEDYDGHGDNIIHRSRGYDIFNKNLRMVVLLDHGSASASEILADALHYWGVAKLVGVNSFGKGSVQELVDIADGSALKVTVARWLGPDGIQIPIQGIAPDVKIDLTDTDAAAGKDPQLDKAIELLKAQ